jgi:serine/threonine-protein kinase
MLVPGARVGRWTLQRRLGHGGAGQVWASSAEDRDELVALKLCSLGSLHLDALAREVEALAAVQHPRIVRVVDHGIDGGCAWVAFQMVHGTDLEGVVAAWRAVPPEDRWVRVERILRDLVDALEAVHAAGMLHRDLKPANVLVDVEGRATLTDFGIARDAGARATAVGQLVGTVAYMAPEVIEARPIDGRADLYGLGGVLYTLLTGRRPIEADSVAGFLARHLNMRPTPPHRWVPDVPMRLERIAMRLLEKDPALRYPNAEAVRRALEGVGGAEPPRLHGRSDVFSALARRMSGPPGVVRLVGPAGSGRTALLRALAQHAEESGLKVVWGLTAPRGGVGLLDDPARVPALDPEGVLFASADEVVEPTDVALSRLDAEALVSLWVDAGVVSDVAMVLAGRVEGTPLAWPGGALDLLGQLAQEGWLVPASSGGWALADGLSRTSLGERGLPAVGWVRRLALERYERLPAEARDLAALLAVVDQPIEAALLARMSERPAQVPQWLSALVGGGLALSEPGLHDHVVRFALPGSARAIAESLPASVRTLLHGRIADALSRVRSRTGGGRELARHLAAAGRAQDAVAVWAKLGEASLSASRLDEVVEAASALASLGAEVEADSLRGRAALAGRDFSTAIDALRRALRGRGQTAEARMGDELALADSLRRSGQRSLAATVLDRLLTVEDLSDGSRLRALQLRGAVAFHQGDLVVAAARLGEAVELAQAGRDVTAEARVRMLLGAVRALELDLVGARDQLEAADDALSGGGDAATRARVLVYGVGVDRALGRLGPALHRAEALVDLVNGARLFDLGPAAWSTLAAARLWVGLGQGAHEAAARALELASAMRQPDADAVLRAARVLVELGVRAPSPLEPFEGGRLRDRGLTDTAGQALALKARALATIDPLGAVALARAATLRPPPSDPRAWFDRTVDGARALLEAGRPDEALEVSEPLLRVALRALDGVWAEVALLRIAAGDLAAEHDLVPLLQRLAAGLPSRLRASFEARSPVAAVLERHHAANGSQGEPG